MVYDPTNPIVVQGDRTVLAEIHSPKYAEVRDALACFAELVKSPEHIHTYQISPLSVWNAVAAGYRVEEMIETLTAYAKYDVPGHVLKEIEDYASRYGRLKLLKSEEEGYLLLDATDRYLAEEIAHNKPIIPLLAKRVSPTSFLVARGFRGRLKLELTNVGWPPEDLVGYVDGEELRIGLREITASGTRFLLRAYQRAAAECFYAGGSVRGGSGVVVLPCGAGKTIVGMDVMAQVGASVLILTTSVSAVRQWKEELLDKTDLDEDLIGEYSGFRKEIRPVTLSTYQILTHRKDVQGEFTHFHLFADRNWGLVIYDEVHVLPAPVFQFTADIQARRRLGLTATLVREDGRVNEVFALIGPKKYDVPWKELEKQGWIAKALCKEVRLPLPDSLRMDYAVADKRQRFRIASENPDKLEMVRQILKGHPGESTLIIGQYISQLEKLAAELNVPMIYGNTPQRRRDELYRDFRCGAIPILMVSKVANFALDLPDAQVAIQVSGTFGSRQEEAQRLGRILRPKSARNTAHFYTLVSRDTREIEFARNRQLFLAEQGYTYEIVDAERFSEMDVAN